jgi:hypothetical protein
MATLHQDGMVTLFMLRVPLRKLLNICETQLIEGKNVPIDKDSILKEADSMAERSTTCSWNGFQDSAKRIRQPYQR